MCIRDSAYIDLSSASDRATRVTVNDLRADGLPTAKVKDAPPDSIDQGSADFVLDFDWKKAKLSQDEYNKKVVEADELYAKMLTILLSEIKKVAPAPTK